MMMMMMMMMMVMNVMKVMMMMLMMLMMMIVMIIMMMMMMDASNAVWPDLDFVFTGLMKRARPCARPRFCFQNTRYQLAFIHISYLSVTPVTSEGKIFQGKKI